MTGSWTKSAAWREIIETADEWQLEATAFVDDPATTPRRLGVLTHRLVTLCDFYGSIDPGPIHDAWCQIEAQRGKQTMGPRVAQKKLEGIVRRAIGILDRLRVLGTSDSPPDKRGENGANSANNSKLFSGSIPENADVRDLVAFLDAERGKPKEEKRSDAQIARDFTGETKDSDRKAKSLLAQIRRMRKDGRINL